MVSVYKPSAQNATYFLNWLSHIIEFFSITLEKQMIIGNFSLILENKSMKKFMDLYNLINLIKTAKCFKGTETRIDLLLINQKCSLNMQTHLESALND